MRIAPLLAFAGAPLLVVSCSSSSKDDDADGGATSAPTGATTSADASTATADGSATTTATGDPTPTSLPADPADAIKAFYGLGGGSLSDSEATCVVGSTGPDIVAPLNEALSGGEIDAATGKALLKAFAACEPAAYVDQTASSIETQSGATKEQAMCVLKAVDKLFVSDDAVLSQAASNTATAEWPAAEHDRFSAAVKTCVPDDLAAKIVDA